MVVPALALLCLRPRIVLRLAGLEVRPLRQCDRLLVGRRTAAVLGELAPEHGDPVLDVGTTARPPPHQLRIHAGDLPHRPLPTRTGDVHEPQPQLTVEVGFECGVVRLGRGDDVLMKDRAVDRQPLALPGLNLVRDRDVGVEVRIAGTRVAVHERGRDQPTCLDLACAAGALAGEDRVRLQEVQGLEDGRVVRHLDLPRDVGRCDGPEG